MLGDFVSLVRRQVRRTGFDVVRLQPEPRRFEPHETLWLKQLGINTVVDVGAHEGEFVGWIRRALPTAQITAIEPLEECAKLLDRLAQSDKRLRVFHCAAGAAAGVLTIHQNAYSMASSLRPLAETHRAAFPFTATIVGHHPVEVKPLDNIVDVSSIEAPLLIKVDVQGFEREVLAGAAAVISRATVAIIEVSFVELYEGQALFEEIAAMFGAFGFRYQGNLWQLRDPRNGSVLQADAVFVRPAS